MQLPLSAFSHDLLIFQLVAKASKYFSTWSKPHNSLTTDMVAGTGNWNSKGESLEPVRENNCTLAAFIASLVALCTDDARSRGGSPEAVRKH